MSDCGICKEEQRDPKVLNCLHSFCKDCLSDLVNKDPNHLSCPLCHAPFQLPSGKVELLPSPLSSFSPPSSSSSSPPPLPFLKESKGPKPLSCEFCEKRAPSSFCSQCEQFSCDECRQIHLKGRLTKEHFFPFLEKRGKEEEGKEEGKEEEGKEGKEEGKEEGYLCKTHGNYDVDVYCRTCHEAMCASCVIPTHLNHEVIKIQDFSAEFGQKLQEALQSAKTKEERLLSILSSYPPLLQALKERSSEASQKIQRYFFTLQERLLQRETELLQDLAVIKSFKERELLHGQMVLEERLERLREARRISEEKLLEKGDQRDLGEDFQKAMEEMIGSEADDDADDVISPHLEMLEVTLMPAEELVGLLIGLGSVTGHFKIYEKEREEKLRKQEKEETQEEEKRGKQEEKQEEKQEKKEEEKEEKREEGKESMDQKEHEGEKGEKEEKLEGKEIGQGNAQEEAFRKMEERQKEKRLHREKMKEKLRLHKEKERETERQREMEREREMEVEIEHHLHHNLQFSAPFPPSSIPAFLPLFPQKEGVLFQLIYDAQIHGFSNAIFHSLCDDFFETLVVVSLTNGKIFGGFNPGKWTGRNVSKYADKAFLFSLTNEKERSVKRYPIKPEMRSEAIYADPSVGPVFGWSHNHGDLFLDLDKLSSCHSFPHSFELKSKTELAGSPLDWSIDNIQVFLVLGG